MAQLDLRPMMFRGAAWYDALAEPTDDRPSAWYVAKATDEYNYTGPLLTAAFAFARDHGLVDRYRTLFAGIRPRDLTVARADAEHRNCSFPIWSIANELIVARYLERILGWRYLGHEPPGRGERRGDWLFIAASGRIVFIEVKSFAEQSMRLGQTTHVGAVPDRSPRVIEAMREAYGQLPDDGRATLVVLVGDAVVSSPLGVFGTDVFGALFGAMQITMQVLPEYDPTTVKIGPSLHDMFIHHGKHRRLGCVCGLVVRGADEPGLHCYAIQNPWADRSVRLADSDIDRVERVVWDEQGRGRDLEGIRPEEAWPLLDANVKA